MCVLGTPVAFTASGSDADISLAGTFTYAFHPLSEGQDAFVVNAANGAIRYTTRGGRVSGSSCGVTVLHGWSGMHVFMNSNRKLADDFVTARCLLEYRLTPAGSPRLHVHIVLGARRDSTLS